MRVTFNTLFRNTLRDVQRTAADYAKAQHQVSSGVKLQRGSDNPSAAGTALTERAEIRTIDRYRSATDSVESRLLVVDTVLTDVIRHITAAQTQAAAGRNTVATPEARDALALAVEGIREAIFSAATTSYRGMYLFSGAGTAAAPYTKTGAVISAYQGDQTVVAVDVSRTSSVAVTLDGQALLQGGAAQDLFQTLEALAGDIRAGNMTGIDARMGELDAAFSRATQAQGRIGSSLTTLASEQQRLGESRRASDTRRSSAEEANLASAISEMTRAQQAYEAAIAATGATQRLTLLDYLR
jgi:flagellar hook-associated protein 3 FlgL